MSVDDSKVDYTSQLDIEERRRRLSDCLVDKNLEETIRLEKMFRQMQRQLYCGSHNRVRFLNSVLIRGGLFINLLLIYLF